MANVIRSIKGTRDFYPSEMVKRQWLIGHMRAASEAFGYQPYDGPCLETLELYAAKSGEELVKEQAFVFEDRGGDPVTLRPELTPTLARMVAEKENELFSRCVGGLLDPSGATNVRRKGVPANFSNGIST